MKKTMICLCLLLLLAAARGQQPQEGIPSTLAITYYAQPANRVGLRDYMVHTGIRQFEKWKSEGLLRDYRVLFSSYLDTDTPAMMLLLDFSDVAAATRWMTIEKSVPGGLSQDALKLISSSQTAQMDHIFHGGSASSVAHDGSVYMIIPYEFYVTAPEYAKYMEQYGVPQFDGWLEENVLASYDVYRNRYSASKPWGSLIVFEYKDAEALGRREEVMRKVRDKLQSNPTWKSISETKSKIREEREAFIAQKLLVPNTR
jgi:hypothetical protein